VAGNGHPFFGQIRPALGKWTNDGDQGEGTSDRRQGSVMWKEGFGETYTGSNPSPTVTSHIRIGGLVWWEFVVQGREIAGDTRSCRNAVESYKILMTKKQTKGEGR